LNIEGTGFFETIDAQPAAAPAKAGSPIKA